MKKLLPVLGLSLLFSLACAEEALVQDVVEDVSAVEVSEQDSAAMERVSQKLSDEYASLGLHEQIESALQKVADDNREDFEIALALRGVDAQDENGNVVRVLPLPTYFLVR